MKSVICLVGSKRAGKNTVSSFLKEISPNIIEIALADKLKNVCASTFQIRRDWFDNEMKEVPLISPVKLNIVNLYDILEAFDIHYLGPEGTSKHLGVELNTARRIAQYVGTEILRSCNENIHCEHAVMDLPDNSLCTITDCRFFSEFDYFHRNFYHFFPVFVHNEKAETIAKGDNHASEKDVLEIGKKCMYTIDNNGTLEELKARAYQLANLIFLKMR